MATSDEGGRSGDGGVGVGVRESVDTWGEGVVMRGSGSGDEGNWSVGMWGVETRKWRGKVRRGTEWQ